MTVAIDGALAADAAPLMDDAESAVGSSGASASSPASPPATAAHSGRHFTVGVVACTALLLALLWGGLGLELAFDKAQTTYHASLNVANLSQIVDEHVASVLSAIDSALDAAKSEYENHRSNPDSRALPAALGASVPGIHIITPAGQVGPAHQLTSDDTAASDGYREALAADSAAEHDRLVIGRPVRVAASSGQRWEVTLSRRLFLNGSFAGIVATTIDPTQLSAAFDKANIGNDGFIAIIGRDDFVVRARSTRTGVAVPHQDLKNTPLPAALAKAEAGAFLDTDPNDGAPRIVGFRALARFPLVIEVGASKAELLSGYDTRRRWLVVAAASVSIVFLGFAVLLIRQNEGRRRAKAVLIEQARELRASREEAVLARNAARQADHAKSEFLANMSHELRTPLNAIIGYSEVMSTAVFGSLSDKYRDYAGSVHTAGTHLLNIINDILDLSKIEAGRLELFDEEISVGELLDGCRRMLADRGAAGGITLACEKTDLMLWADPLRLQQMLLNLLSNAVKFTLRGGQVSACARISGAGEAVIEISDTGIGMKPEDLKKALEPFGQVSEPAMRMKEGTGLGLPLVRRLIELHGGRMEIDSRYGEGTRIALVLPASRVRHGRMVMAAD